MGVAQANIEMDGIVAHPDIMTGNKDTIVELKDTVAGKQLNFYDETFRSYLRQLCMLSCHDEYRKGIISIRYNIKELKWIKSDSQGDYFFRPFGAKDAGIKLGGRFTHG